MPSLNRDLSLAVRRAGRSPMLPGLVILCVALGVGLNTAIFSIVDAVLLRPLPYDDPERLVLVHDTHIGPGGAVESYPVSPLNFLAWRDSATSVERLEAMEPRHLNLAVDGVPQRVPAAGVTAGLFRVLGVEPLLGRSFTQVEDGPGGEKVAILAHGAWHGHFDGAEAALGRTLLLDGERYEIVGVMPPGFGFLTEVDVWIPLALDRANLVRGHSHYLSVVGRLPEGTTATQAGHELTAISRRQAVESNAAADGWGAAALRLRESLAGDLTKNVMILLVAVGLVLLIASSNVSSLLLTRALEQRSELALRVACGAGRGGLVRQMVTESAVFAAAGGALGLLIAHWTIRLSLASGAFETPLVAGLGLDARVLAFAVAVSVVAGVAPGALVAWRSTGPALLANINEGGHGFTTGVGGRRLQAVLVVVQVCLTTALLVGAGLVGRSLAKLQETAIGFEPSGLLKIQIDLPTTQYPEQERIRSFWQDLLPRLEALRSVESVGVTSALPVSTFAVLTSLAVEDAEEVTPEEVQIANLRRISPGYLDTLGVPLIEGRGIGDSDDMAAPPVALISQSFAERYWPSRGALGRRIKRGGLANTYLPWRTVVGVVADVQDSALGETVEPTLYIPMSQGASPQMHVLLRTAAPTPAVVAAVRESVLEVDPLQPITGAMTMDEHVAESVSRQRLNSWLLGSFGGLGTLLSMAGIFGLLSYAVGRRTNELAVRMVLGASHRDLQRLVLRYGLGLTGVGVVLGSAFAFGSSRLLSSLLYGVSPTDPWTFLATALGVLAVGLTASYLPARRARSVQPAPFLRDG